MGNDQGTPNVDAPETSDNHDEPSTYSTALAETRRVVDVQVEMIENTDTEIVSLMRFSFLALGGVVTLIAYVPDLISEVLPWVSVAVLLLILSVLLAVFIYRGVTLYAGFGDHGYDAHVPRQKLRYDDLIDTSDPGSRVADFDESDAPPLDVFRAALLDEHQSGISHNNVEIKYRSQIHQQIILLLLIAILMLGVGLTVGIADPSGPFAVALILIATIGVVVAAVYTIIKTIGLICRFIRTKADPNRLSYGYAFERRYPHLSQLCSFVTTYLYDPVDDDW